MEDEIPGEPQIEGGLAGYHAGSWFSLLAPAKTPKPIVDKLNATLNEIVKDPKFRAFFEPQGFRMMGDSPQASQARLASELQRWGAAVRESGASIQ